MMPLTLANMGEENLIHRVGGSPEVKKHLEDLGFVAGGTVTVVAALGGNVIVKVKEARIAISEEMARKIMTVQVVKLHGEGPVKRRIMDMGITRGTQVFVRKVAPLGDPMEVTVRGYELSLRKADTEMIEVE